MDHRQWPEGSERDWMPLRAARRIFGVLAAVLLGGASTAHAAPFVEVQYDLSGSSASTFIPLLNVTVNVPPNGTIRGTQKLRYTGGSGSYTGTAGTGPTLATGPVELLTFNLYVHATVTDQGYLGTIYLNTNNLHFEFLGLTPTAAAAGGQGLRLPGGTVTPLGASGYFRVTGSVHCTNLCAAFFMTASQTTGLKPKTFTAPLPRLTGAMGQPHTLTGTATGIAFAIQPEPSPNLVYVYGTTFLVGREISRTAVPEPGTLPLLVTGLAGLGAAGAAWRRGGGRGSARAERVGEAVPLGGRPAGTEPTASNHCAQHTVRSTDHVSLEDFRNPRGSRSAATGSRRERRPCARREHGRRHLRPLGLKPIRNLDLQCD